MMGKKKCTNHEQKIPAWQVAAYTFYIVTFYANWFGILTKKNIFFLICCSIRMQLLIFSTYIYKSENKKLSILTIKHQELNCFLYITGIYCWENIILLHGQLCECSLCMEF